MYNHFDSFVCLPFTISIQKLVVQVLILLSTALHPSSACSIYAGGDFHEFVIHLRNSV